MIRLCVSLTPIGRRGPDAPVDDFELSLTHLDDPAGFYQPRHRVPGSGPRILLGFEGEALLETDAGRHVLASGGAVFVPASDGTLRADGSGRSVQASVP